ncbi:MAG: eCIS core domain-containing protein [Anaerolineae bacterium]
MAPAIRRPLETILQRSLSTVRLHTSPIAAELRAEAFTAGEHIVFAPGRMELHTKPGISLLGHKLAHVGQPLAFKSLPGESAESADLDEQSANQQERLIRNIIERGWPNAPRMELRQAARSLAAITESSGGSSNRNAVEAIQGVPDWLNALQSGAAPNGQGNLVARELVDSRSTTPTQQNVGGAEETPAGQDLNSLARQVYDIIKVWLRVERDRHNVYSR